MKYQILLCDIDDTLFDFHRGEHIALGQTFAHFGIADTPFNRECYLRANAEQWKKLERGETTQKELRVDRFRGFLADAGLEGDADALSEDYIRTLGQQRIPLPGAVALCEAVSRRMPIYLVTNGITRIQQSRIRGSAVEPFITGMVISEELGVSKPDPRMVLEALAQAGVDDLSRVILLGDSVTSDIGAANNAGVDSILFTNGRDIPCGHPATYAVKTLDEAAAIILR